LVGKLEEKIPLGRSRCRFEDNVTTDLGKKYRVMDGIHLVHDGSGLLWVR
jgi:hypothetical protein